MAGSGKSRKVGKPAARVRKGTKPGGRSGGMSGARRCWLVKTEPSSYSIADLERDGVTGWDGVRNYQARNMLRDELTVGDDVLVYHSNAEPPAVTGLARVVGAARPDPTAFDPRDPHHDPDSDPAAPRWYLVDLAHVETFAVPVDRPRLAAVTELAGMELLRRGSRLSVMPVTPEAFELIVELAHAAVPSADAGAAAGRGERRGGAALAPARAAKDTGRATRGRSGARRASR